MIAQELTCQELVELVTDYLEDALPTPERARFEEHLDDCDGCTAYLDQIRTTVTLVAELCDDHIAPTARDELLRVFRDWKNARA